MRAFLSHSSKDKQLVSTVFEDLGAASCVYDSESFEEGKLSAEEIFRTLKETDLFVLFVSSSALASTWLKHELQVAHHNFAKGRIRGFLIFIIDDTSLEKLPEWLQSFHIIRSRRPHIISRRIRSRLIELNTESPKLPGLFVGRTAYLDELKLALSMPPSEGPSVIGIAGWPGLGRRTLARKLLMEVYPYLPHIQPEIAVPENASVEDFYFGLLDVITSRSLVEWRTEQQAFLVLSEQGKVEACTRKIHELYKEKEVLFLIDDGGMLQDDGGFVPWIEEILSALGAGIRPFMIFIQRQMIPYGKRKRLKNIYLVHLHSFEDNDVRSMLGIMLRESNIDFTSNQLMELTDYLGGHPINVRFAVEYAKQYGLEMLIRDKSDLVQFIVNRATDLLKKVKFSDPLSEKILVLLSDYRILDIDTMIPFINTEDSGIVIILRNLEEKAVIERLGKYYRIAPYLREALSRHFHTYHAEWRREVAGKMAEVANEFKDENDMPLAVLDAGIIANLKLDPQRASSGWLAEFILPSHLLRVARDAYNNRTHAITVEFCREALKKSHIMTTDAQIEAYRLLALSLARLAKENEFWNTLDRLKEFDTVVAKRNVSFLKGFWFRYSGQPDRAEQEFLKAYELDPDNFHVLRELATTLAHQGRFPEAEAYARAALKIVPTNPFIIDCLCEIIIGRASKPSELERNNEFHQLMEDLKWYGELEGRAFYENRNAAYFFKLGKGDEALRYADEAVAKTSWRFSAFVTRAKIRLGLGREIDQVPDDIKQLRYLEADARTGEGKAGQFRIDEIEVRYKMRLCDYRGAWELLQRYRKMPQYLRVRLNIELAEVVRNTKLDDPELKAWAESYGDNSLS